MGVVNDHKVSTPASHRTAHTDSEVLPMLVHSPPASRLRVLTNPGVRENFVVLLAHDEVTDLPAKANGQFASVRGLHHLLAGELAKEPSRKHVGAKLRLRVTRRHRDSQSLDLSRSNLLERLSHNRMMPTMNEPRPHLLHKGHERLLALLPLQSLLVLSHLRQQLLLLVDRQLSDQSLHVLRSNFFVFFNHSISFKFL